MNRPQSVPYHSDGIKTRAHGFLFCSSLNHSIMSAASSTNYFPPVSGCPLVHVTSAKSPQITPFLDTNEVLGKCKT
ncbi:hypothetical protein PILCRDRAFT_440680 [Piloderma croceum F 1598]|uniref:Uncharacterized protein n=1 Tax=Piloderma croceum (strain F 1598) TaxID=765440 RepID=A0A0C3FG01_PILCF|nr:hypothetical protein PILCRDRAFT_440680 [Piloderma croceum F 1598]